MSLKEQSNIKVLSASRGLVICYIGDGKGKTTAAMGLAARASGAGLNVYILQFVKAASSEAGKESETGEWPVSNEIKFFDSISIPKTLGQITTEIAGRGFVGILGDHKQKQEHIRAAVDGLAKARETLTSKKYQVVILDEIISAVEVDLLSQDDIVDLIKLKPDDVHLVVTGHIKYPKIIKLCDMVTEMKAIDHPYYQGILAQEGIDY